MSVNKNKKTGKWEVQIFYHDSNGDRRNKHKRGFATKKEALEFERDFLAKNEGSLDMKFKDFVSLYLADKKLSWSPITYSNNNSKFRIWILPYLGEKRINEIKPLDIRQWQIKVINQGAGQVMQRKLCQVLSAVFNYAVKFYDLSDNPCKKVDPIGSYKRSQITFWTKEQFEEFIKLVDNEALALAYKTLFYTGLRIGELCALRPVDFDFNVPKLHVSRNLQKIEGKIIIKEPKTPKSNRDVILPKKLALEIEDFINRSYGIGPEDRVFYYDKAYYGNKMREICRKNGIEHIRIHDLRHSHASLLIELGFSAHLIAERLGHESVSTTLEIYSHLYPNKQFEAADRIDALI